MSKGLILLVVGVVLILAGLGLVIYQIRKVNLDRALMRGMDFGPKGISLKTSFPGLVVMAIGAVLAVIGSATPN